VPDYDFVIAGAGLAGACAALHLSGHGSVLVLEKGVPAGGGSGAAAGLINPILGLRARPVWRIDKALSAIDETISLADASDLYDRGPTLRPAYGTDQVERFRRAAQEFPEHARWIGPSGCAERYPHVVARDGGLLITTGGIIDITAFVLRMLSAAKARGAVLRSGWAVADWDDTGVTQENGERISSRHTLLALGRAYAQFPELACLRLHQVKGQTIRLTRPPGLPDDLPHLAGRGYVARESHGAAESGGRLIAGSTYEHTFEHIRPTKRQTSAIHKKITAMLPALADAEILDERAGVRVTVPGIRLPMVGPLPGRKNVWIFTGFGAKGLLTAPLAARELAAYFSDPGLIPGETRVRTARR
jgi:glycine oxidase